MTMAKFDTNEFRELLLASKIGCKLVYEEVTGSTMDDARRFAHSVSEYPHGTAVLSERQTKARGAKNHTWDASNSGNIYVSFILHLSPGYKTQEGKNDLEVAACLAVLETVHKYGVPHAVPKWPNDIWVKGHKLAGFLAEDGRYDIPGSLNCLLILGMGININADIRRNAELNSIATSLLCEKDGLAVNREKFLADVCLALEAKLSSPRESLLSAFKTVNLFHKHSKILVSCLSGGTVIDADFIEICNNWDITFLDNITGKILTGSSENYSVRPKVVSKILVVSSGQQTTSASHLSKWFISLVDTSKYVVCLVPENAIIGSDVWMKTCSLLVIAEQVSEPDIFGDHVSGYIKSGGSVLANGFGSSFLAKYLGIQTKEFSLESSISDSDIHLVNVQVQTTIELHEKFVSNDDGDKPCPQIIPTANDAAFFSKPIVFPTSCVCFQFYEDEKALLFEGIPSAEDCAKDLDIAHSNDTDNFTLQLGKELDAAQLRAFYLNGDKHPKSVALFLSKSRLGGKVGFLGFDAGVEFPVLFSDLAEFVAAHTDRFRRDKLMMQILDFLLN